MPHDVALICKNGHLINEYSHEYDDYNSAFCPDCGAPTINKCPNCQHDIKGQSTDEFSYLVDYKVPAYCEYCGSAFPWTESAIKNAELIIQEEEEFSEQLKSSIIESLPNIITETPGTSLATMRIKKGLSTAGKFTAEAIRQFVIDFGCEVVKKSIGL